MNTNSNSINRFDIKEVKTLRLIEFNNYQCCCCYFETFLAQNAAVEWPWLLNYSRLNPTSFLTLSTCRPTFQRHPEINEDHVWIRLSFNLIVIDPSNTTKILTIPNLSCLFGLGFRYFSLLWLHACYSPFMIRIVL